MRKTRKGVRKLGKIISIVNQKGGVGKTTSCINLIAALGKLGKKCLLVDIDSQGNSTSGLGINKREVKSSTYDLLINDVRCSTAIVKTQFDNVDILPSSIDLAAADIELVDIPERTMRLRKALATVRQDYDYTGDMDYLKANITRARKAMNFYMQMYDEERSLVCSSYLVGHDGDKSGEYEGFNLEGSSEAELAMKRASALGNGYFDASYMPEYDFHTNMYFS